MGVAVSVGISCSEYTPPVIGTTTATGRKTVELDCTFGVVIVTVPLNGMFVAMQSSGLGSVAHEAGLLPLVTVV